VVITIQALSSNHDRAAFDCGNESMNGWLRQSARQHQEKDLARTYVAISSSEPGKIVGYYAIATTSIATEGMAGTKLPSNVSAVLLGRLAIDASCQGQGLGEFILMDALARIVRTAELVGVRCIVVDAIDENATRFYERYGFVRLTTKPMTLVMHLHTVRQLLQA